MQASSPTPDLPAAIGEAIRAGRTARGESMRALAARAGISQPMLSKLENGQLLPSLTTVYALAAALEIPASRMLPPVASLDQTLDFGVGDASAHSRARLISGGADAQFHVYRVTGRVGDDDGGFFRHAGPEFVQVLIGVVELQRPEHPPVTLAAGEYLTYDSEIPHRWATVQNAEFLLVSPT